MGLSLYQNLARGPHYLQTDKRTLLGWAGGKSEA